MPERRGKERNENCQHSANERDHSSKTSHHPTFLVLNLGLHVVNGIRRLDFERNGFSRQGLDKDLHAASKTEHQVQSRFFLDVVIGERAAIFQLFSGKDQALLVRRNAFLVLNLGLRS